jgi:hypothetical protein
MADGSPLRPGWVTLAATVLTSSAANRTDPFALPVRATTHRARCASLPGPALSSVTTPTNSAPRRCGRRRRTRPPFPYYGTIPLRYALYYATQSFPPYIGQWLGSPQAPLNSWDDLLMALTVIPNASVYPGAASIAASPGWHRPHHGDPCGRFRLLGCNRRIKGRRRSGNNRLKPRFDGDTQGHIVELKQWPKPARHAAIRCPRCESPRLHDAALRAGRARAGLSGPGRLPRPHDLRPVRVPVRECWGRYAPVVQPAADSPRFVDGVDQPSGIFGTKQARCLVEEKTPNEKAPDFSGAFRSGPPETRTRDPLIKSQLL